MGCRSILSKTSCRDVVVVLCGCVLPRSVLWGGGSIVPIFVQILGVVIALPGVRVQKCAAVTSRVHESGLAVSAAVRIN